MIDSIEMAGITDWQTVHRRSAGESKTNKSVALAFSLSLSLVGQKRAASKLDSWQQHFVSFCLNKLAKHECSFSPAMACHFESDQDLTYFLAGLLARHDMAPFCVNHVLYKRKAFNYSSQAIWLNLFDNFEGNSVRRFYRLRSIGISQSVLCAWLGWASRLPIESLS